MRVLALVGKSGTGKSHHSLNVARDYGCDFLIDDGLLIGKNRIIAGTSAKGEKTRIASIKHAIFLRDDLMLQMKQAIEKYLPQCLLVLGTSEKMVYQIAARLGLGEYEKIIHIEDVASPEEIELAQKNRIFQGKHVIPVPTFMIKKDFSGYFIHPLRRIKDGISREQIGEKTIIRPTYSYYGGFSISDGVLVSIVRHEANKILGVKVSGTPTIKKYSEGINVDFAVSVKKGINIVGACKSAQGAVKYYLELYTAMNVMNVNIYVKNIK